MVFFNYIFLCLVCLDSIFMFRPGSFVFGHFILGWTFDTCSRVLGRQNEKKMTTHPRL